MKKTLIILSLSLFLLSCSENQEEEVISVEKKDFYIETKNLSDFEDELYLEKTWRVSSSQDINLNSQANGRVLSVYVKEWDYVYKGQNLAVLEDNVSNFWLNLKRAKNSLEKAELNYETTKNQLDKQISDLKINLEDLKLDELNSKSSLELEKIDNSIKKIAIDYDNLKISNLQTIEWFKASTSKDLISFNTYVDDVIDFSDKLYGITDKYDDLSNKYYSYLWAKDNIQKKVTEDLIRDLIYYKNYTLKGLDYNSSDNTIFDSNNKIISEWYSIISDLLTNLELSLDNSLASVNSFSETTISSYKTAIGWLWSTYNLNKGWFVSLDNSINSFLDTYKNNEESLLKQIELLESDKQIYVKWLDVKLEIDNSTLDEAISNKELSLKQLNTVIVDANIALAEAQKNYDKLYIKSPISWIVWEKFISVWQELNIWTKAFSISNNSDNEIIISLSKNELDLVKVWSQVIIELENKKVDWYIYSISKVADSNLKYITRIGFNDDLDFIWDVVNIKIPFNSYNIVLPLNLVKVIWNNIWELNVFNSWSIEELEINLGNIYSDKVEILSDLSSIKSIIVTDISNYDENKFKLILK